MMRIARFAVILTLLLVILTGCSKNVRLYKEAKKQFQYGNYETALRYNAESLKLKPNYQKAQELLPQIYPIAVKTRLDNVARIKQANAASKWDLLVPEYQALVDISDTMGELPRLVHPKTKIPYTFETVDYKPQLQESKMNAAEYHYQLGVQKSLQSDDPDVQRAASDEFKLALSFVENYKDAAERYAQTRKKAVKRIAIFPFEDSVSDKARFGNIAEILVDNVISTLVRDKSTAEYAEIINRATIDAVIREQQLAVSGMVDEASSVRLGQLLSAHEILTGKILQVDVVPSRVTSVELKESANIEIEQGDADYEPELENDEDVPKKKVTQSVQCLYYKYTKVASVRIMASFTITDVSSGTVKVQDTCVGTFEFMDTWARKKSGDDRALTPATKALIAKEEPFPPSEQQMVSRALEELSQQFINKIKGYVK
jgi:tetratricopeptide (TPR) repeat protein